MIRNIKSQEKYYYTFSRHEKVADIIGNGETVKIITQDAFSNNLVSEDQKPSELQNEGINPLSGPFYIEDAEVGDNLQIKIISIDPLRDFGVSALCKKFGGLVGTESTRMLTEPLPEKVWIYKILEDGSFYHSPKLHFDYTPFVGTIATADSLESISSVAPGYFGGNMDVKDVKPGNIVYLPVSVEGAYLYIGDCHACQGDGELSGVALEIAGEVTIQVNVIKNKKICWPRIESENEIMVVGSGKPLEDAARIAYAELIDWLVEEHDWNKINAYHLLGQCGKMYLGNMVDTWYSMVAKVEKKYL